MKLGKVDNETRREYQMKLETSHSICVLTVIETMAEAAKDSAKALIFAKEWDESKIHTIDLFVMHSNRVESAGWSVRCTLRLATFGHSETTDLGTDPKTTGHRTSSIFSSTAWVCVEDGRASTGRGWLNRCDCRGDQNSRRQNKLSTRLTTSARPRPRAMNVNEGCGVSGYAKACV